MYILDNIKNFALAGKTAAFGNEGEISYSELESRSESLASFLLLKYPNRAPVVLWGDKEHDMISGILACLKTGHPYVIIPNYYPLSRVQMIVNRCKCCVILNVCHYKLDAIDCDIYEKETINEICINYTGTVVDSTYRPEPDDMVCLFYTSGSTGIPKGVMITRRNIEALIDWWYPISNLGIDNPRMLNFTPYGFSSSLATIYIGLAMLGAKLYAVDRILSTDYTRLIDYILKVDPHYFDCTPSFANICLFDPRFSSESLPSLRQLTVGGEPCPHKTAKLLLDRFPKTQILNAYGATETTIGTISCEITREMTESNKPIPIGYTAPGSKIYVVDEERKQLPEGLPGELVIVSDMITAGYYKDPEQTVKSYFITDNGIRGYYTGDIVSIEDGLVYYIGRADNMVKVGGYRVEMEEVERYLSKIGMIENCAVSPAEDDQRVILLTAYVVLKPGNEKGIQSVIKIKKELSQWVQEYMIPQKIIFLDALPFNSNGKTDRKALHDMSLFNNQLGENRI